MSLVWIEELRDDRGRWARISGEPQTLAPLLEGRAEDAANMDFMVPVRFRNVATGEILAEGDAFAYFFAEEEACGLPVASPSSPG